MEDMIGKQLGPYQIVAQLGIGGMATVFKAYQPKMDRYVALKILPRHLSKNPEFVSRFSQEARIIAQLEHPHILPVHDFGESDGYTYLAMRLVKGGSLNDLLKRQGKLELNRIKTIITQVGEALDYAHNKGVIHRDFKPGNILMDEAGNCLLTDFGIAKLIEVTSHLTHPGGVLGTPVYISPEQGDGRPIDHRSDLYSLGVVLYQMVTGEVPYKADTPMAVIYKHIHDPIPLPGKRVPGLPESVERVILRSLAKDPNDRYASAAEFVKSLQNAIEPAQIRKVQKRDLDLEPTEVTKGYSAESAKPLIKSYVEKGRAGRGWIYAVSAVILLCILGGAGWFYYRNILSAVPILKIESEPSNADVYIDGGHVGTSPVAVKELASGTHKVRISKDRYEEYTEDLFIQKDNPRTVNAVLVPKPFGDLEVVSNPSGAEIFIDEVQKGITPINIESLPKGIRKVTIKKEGFDPWQDIVEIVPLQKAEISVDLKIMAESPKVSEVQVVLAESFGSLKVESIPDGAEVFIDGKKQGVSPLELKEVKEGSYKVVVKKEGYKDWSQAVEVLKGKQRVLQASLSIRPKFTNSIGMEFVYIKPGTFMMCGPENEAEKEYASKVHQVALTKGFYMGVTEVTQGQWREIMGNNPSEILDNGDIGPVENVSWNDAQEFIKQLNKRENTDKYRLPTEAEWEYACRAGSTTRFYFGEDQSVLGEYAWFKDNSDSRTHPVGKKKPNAWGLYDMLGNVFEWVADWYGDFTSDSVIDPKGPSSGSTRVIRGGYWDGGAIWMFSNSRMDADSGDKNMVIGFRLVRIFNEDKIDETAIRDQAKVEVKDVKKKEVKEPEKTLTNSLGMDFIYVEPGIFMMGSPTSEKYRDFDETQHQVALTKGFYMGVTEVTQKQWKEIMGDNPSKFKDCGDDCPVDRVSWNDAQEFIKQLNKRENTDKYRLPTEAEWEYACRAGSITAYFYGDDESKLGEYAWIRDNSDDKTHPVGGKKPNAWGLYDMHGNLFEWCEDFYENILVYPVIDPEGPSSGSYRVYRGGFYDYKADNCRCASRDWSSPDGKHNWVGFRLARTL